MPRIPNAMPLDSPHCDPRLPEAALRYRRTTNPPLTSRDALGAINVTAWLYRDRNGTEGIQVNPNVTIAELTRIVWPCGNSGCGGRLPFRGPNRRLVPDAAATTGASDFHRTCSVPSHVRTHVAALLSGRALVLLLRQQFVERRSRRTAPARRRHTEDRLWFVKPPLCDPLCLRAKRAKIWVMDELSAVDGSPLAPESLRMLEYLRTRATEINAPAISARIAAAAHELEEVVAKVSASDARLRPVAGKWTIADVVDHMAQTNVRAAGELRHLLEGRRPPLPPVLRGAPLRRGSVGAVGSSRRRIAPLANCAMLESP